MDSVHISSSSSESFDGIILVATVSRTSQRASLDIPIVTAIPWSPKTAQQSVIGLQSLQGEILESEIQTKNEPKNHISEVGKDAVREVRPAVQEFLKRVVVPILVARYIASLRQTKPMVSVSEPV